MHSKIDLLDDILQSHKNVIGKDFSAYRNHCYRVVNFCAALAGDNSPCLEKFAISAAFHDLAIWENQTFDYLAPSVVLAEKYLTENNKTDWNAEISSMILLHHKITKSDSAYLLAEIFRKADWMDVSLGILNFGVSRSLIGEVYAAFPTLGFHARLVQLAARQWVAQPLNPLPMVRW